MHVLQHAVWLACMPFGMLNGLIGYMTCCMAWIGKRCCMLHGQLAPQAAGSALLGVLHTLLQFACAVTNITNWLLDGPKRYSWTCRSVAAERSSTTQAREAG